MNILLESYKKGFRIPNQLRFIKAGTLRYRNEICYVIVVTADDALLRDAPTLTEDEAMIENIQLPFVRLQHQRTQKELWCSWEQTVFAFHYPDTNHALQLPPSEVDILPVKHHCFDQNLQIYSSRCQPLRCHAATFHSDYKCPDLVEFEGKGGIPLAQLHDTKGMMEKQNVADYQERVLQGLQMEHATKNITL